MRGPGVFFRFKLNLKLSLNLWIFWWLSERKLCNCRPQNLDTFLITIFESQLSLKRTVNQVFWWVSERKLRDSDWCMNLQSSDLASWGNFDHQIYMRLMPCSLQPEFSPTLSNMFKNFLCKANYYMLTKKYMFSKPSGNRNVAPICWVCLFLIFFNRAKFQKDWTTFILDILQWYLLWSFDRLQKQ